MLFIDFERTFYTIKRHAIWTALKNVGVPEKIIALIGKLYQNADCSVRKAINFKLTKEFGRDAFYPLYSL